MVRKNDAKHYYLVVCSILLKYYTGVLTKNETTETTLGISHLYADSISAWSNQGSGIWLLSILNQ